MQFGIPVDNAGYARRVKTKTDTTLTVTIFETLATRSRSLPDDFKQTSNEAVSPCAASSAFAHPLICKINAKPATIQPDAALDFVHQTAPVSGLFCNVSGFPEIETQRKFPGPGASAVF